MTDILCDEAGLLYTLIKISRKYSDSFGYEDYKILIIQCKEIINYFFLKFKK